MGVGFGGDVVDEGEVDDEVLVSIAVDVTIEEGTVTGGGLFCGVDEAGGGVCGVDCIGVEELTGGGVVLVEGGAEDVGVLEL